MHAEIVKIDVDSVISAGPISGSQTLKRICWIFVLIGVVTFFGALIAGHAPELVWGAYYTNLLYFMGLSVGAVMTGVIFQIVRATWSPAIRRIGEAHVSFLPWAWILLMCTWAGREYLFPWAKNPAPGKELWMEPTFVYIRFAFLMAFLFFMMWRFVRMSIRGDVGMLVEQMGKRGTEGWKVNMGTFFNVVSAGWQGSEKEIPELQRRLSFNAPIMVLIYAVVYSLFAFEMVMAMDPFWISNMFGGFMFVGNIYLAWAVIGLIAIGISASNKVYGKILQNSQRWDLGKLTFGFCMLWGYLFFSQFLPQWYGNLPEETQWMILRTRDWNMPWVYLGWLVFPLCFIIPFITLLSRDVKRTPKVYGIVALIICIGIWLEKYIIVMPSISPAINPIGGVEIGLFLGFLGVYGLSLQGFIRMLPIVPISHPTTHGSTKW
mgnify:CR=1 FL=1